MATLSLLFLHLYKLEYRHIFHVLSGAFIIPTGDFEFCQTNGPSAAGTSSVPASSGKAAATARGLPQREILRYHVTLYGMVLFHPWLLGYCNLRFK